MAKYLVLIYGDEKEWANMTPGERARIEAGHRAFAGAAGPRILGGEELMPPETATSLRQGPAVTDGPFLETKEVLGGFYAMECADLDEAIRWAAQIPGAWRGSVEVRPVLVLGPR